MDIAFYIVGHCLWARARGIALAVKLILACASLGHRASTLTYFCSRQPGDIAFLTCIACSTLWTRMQFAIRKRIFIISERSGVYYISEPYGLLYNLSLLVPSCDALPHH